MLPEPDEAPQSIRSVHVSFDSLILRGVLRRKAFRQSRNASQQPAHPDFVSLVPHSIQRSLQDLQSVIQVDAQGRDQAEKQFSPFGVRDH